MILNNVRKMYASYFRPDADTSLIPVPINGQIQSNVTNYYTNSIKNSNLKNSWQNVFNASDVTDISTVNHSLPFSINVRTKDTSAASSSNFRIFGNCGYIYKGNHAFNETSKIYDPFTKTLVINPLYSPSTGTNSYYAFSTSFVDVGFDDTPEDPDDYTLSDSNAQKSTAVLTHVDGENNSCISGGGTILDISSTYINNGSSDVTVKEIGIVFKPNGTLPASTYNQWATSESYYTSWEVCNFLITRKVLDEPVVMHPGDSYRFTYKVKV